MKELFRNLLKTPTDSRDILLRRCRKAPDAETTEVLVDARGFEKMSQHVLEFAMPWLREALDEKDA